MTYLDELLAGFSEESRARVMAAIRERERPVTGYDADLAELQALHDSEWRYDMDGLRILNEREFSGYLDRLRALVQRWSPECEPRLSQALSTFRGGDLATATLHAEYCLTSVHVAMGKPELIERE